MDDRTGQLVPPEQTETSIKQRSPVPIPSATDEEDSAPEPAPPSTADTPKPRKRVARFWPTVIVIELTDIAFAVDSILAAIALVGSAPAGADGLPRTPHPKLWVVLTGGMLGVILMRVAAVMFIRLLEKFPRFETAAYLLVIVIGAKLLADWGFNSAMHPHRIDFHSYHHPAFWIFWILMIVAFCVGFIPKKRGGEAALPP
jgi:predicted tellurium resistance membrane protein TerC